MMLGRLQSHRVLAALVGIAVFLGSISPLLLIPQQVRAHGPVTVVGGPGSAADIESAIANTTIAGTVVTMWQKEFVLDQLAWVIAKVVIQGIVRSTINWINSGFEGSPAFVTDLEGFLIDVVDKDIGNFIYGTELGFLCDPFELDIRLALAFKYRSTEEQIACRLTDVVGNLEGFLDGEFSQGGWEGWYQLTVNDNPYQNYIEAQGVLDRRIARLLGVEQQLLDFGRGFLSQKDCQPLPGGGEQCSLVTPGAFIQGQLEQVAGSSVASLIEADEINEIIGALAAQLLNQVFAGGGGLRGLSGSSSGSSYVDRLAAENLLQDFGSGDDNPLIATEQQYRGYVTEALNSVLSTEFRLEQAANQCSAPINPKVGGVSSPDAQAAIDDFKIELNQKQAQADQNIAQLRSIDTRLANATDPDEIGSLNQELNALSQSGQLHDPGETFQEQQRRDQIISAMAQLDAQIQFQISQCNAGGV